MAKSGTWTMCDGAKANYSSGCTCTCALARAQDVRKKLSPRSASCVKLVNRSQRTYLALPKMFCIKHLPNFDQTVVFVGENEKKFRIGYSSIRHRFTLGWKRFFNAHSLLEGDALVFHLIVTVTEHCKFKVYVVRSCRPKQVDGAIRNPTVEAAKIGMAVKEEPLDDLPEDSHPENIYITQRLDLDCNPPRHQLDNLSSEGSVFKFQDVKRFEDFKIHMDGQILDSELPVQARMKYYELCCSQKMFLHDGLIEGLGSKLVAGMISKTSDIASAITSAPSPTLHDLEYWDKALRAFEELGMSVRFLRDRIDKLVKISRACQTVNRSLSTKWAEVEETGIALKEKLSTMDALVESIETLKASKKIAEAEMDYFEEEIEDLDKKFSLVAAAPWT